MSPARYVKESRESYLPRTCGDEPCDLDFSNRRVATAPHLRG